jgi:hypothetical protein
MQRPKRNGKHREANTGYVVDCTEAVSISATDGGFPLGPFLEIELRRRRQYFAMTSTLPSWCVVCF